MDIKEFKQSLEDKTYKPEFTIMQYIDNFFVCQQYLDYIKQSLGYTLDYIDDAYNLYDDFFVADPKAIYVYKCDKFDLNIDPESNSNLVVVTKNIDKNYKDYYNNFILEFPKLDHWMLKDYAYSMLPEVSQSNLDWLIEICNDDVYRLDNELKKLTIFDSKFAANLFPDFIREGVFSDLSSYTIYNLSNALQVKDKDIVKNILKDIKNIDVEPVGLITILYQNIKKLISVWLNPNPTPDNTGLKSNQIYAIRKLPHNFSQEQLISIFLFLTKLDYRLKIGELPVENLIDYIIVNIFTI